MNRIVVRLRAGPDGIFHVEVPGGLHAAPQETTVTIELIGVTSQADEDYARWVARLSGAWQGDFERPPQ